MSATPNPSQPHASLAVDATAKTLQALGYTIHERTDQVLIQAIGGDVRFTVNGNAPTASSGLLIPDGGSIQLGNVEAPLAKFITGSGTPKLEIAAYVA